jgi:hypothetical protein
MKVSFDFAALYFAVDNQIGLPARFVIEPADSAPFRQIVDNFLITYPLPLLQGME